MLPLQHNDLIFSIDDVATPKLATDDVLLQPVVGILKSRSDALIKKQYLF